MKDMTAKDGAVTPRRPWLLAATLLVAACGVAATAHGLYAVAVASGVPTAIAVLYPVIADGLAVVAYGATRRPDKVIYPWLVVIVAAGLSGLAQGVNLRGFGVPGEWLRFGVGMAPAVAVLAVVHLLWLVSRRVETREVGDGTVRQGEGEGAVRGRQLEAGEPGVGPAAGSREGRQHAGRGEASDRAHPGEARQALATMQPPGQVPYPRPGPAAPTVSANGNGHAVTLKEQAEHEALRYLEEHGVLPSENVLAGLAGCSRGTARNALVPMRRDA